MRGKQRVEARSPALIMERWAVEAGLEQGSPPTIRQACPSLREGMVTIEHRQEEGLHATATREDLRRVGRTEGIKACRYFALAYHPQHQRAVGDGTALRHGHRHAAPLLQGFREVSAERRSP